MIHKNIEQTSLEWFQIKWGKVGGTASKGLFVKSDTLFIELLSQHLEEFEPSENFTNEAMQRGKDLEPFAVEYAQKYTGIKFNSVGWIQSDENSILGISPDGITDCETIAIECKCFGRKKHTEILVSNEIPSENVHQLIHYFTVNPKLEKLYFCAFRPEAPKNFIKELTLESEINLGTNAKPKITTIDEAVKLSKKNAKALENRLKKAVNELTTKF